MGLGIWFQVIKIKGKVARYHFFVHNISLTQIKLGLLHSHLGLFCKPIFKHQIVSMDKSKGNMIER